MGKLSAVMLIAVVAIAFAGMAAAGDLHIYKWIDSQGVVHYSDKAPSQPKQKVTLMSLPALPQLDPQSLAEDQAWIASINQWYQSVLKDQAQLEYAQYLESEAAQPAPPENPPDYAEQVSYVTPVFLGYNRFRFRHRHHEPDRDDFMRHFHPMRPPSPAFRSSIWNTQPNPFTQQLYKP